jgi:hypothetical protein
VLKTNRDTRTGGPRRQKNRRIEREPSITDLTVEELCAIISQRVVIDPAYDAPSR